MDQGLHSCGWAHVSALGLAAVTSLLHAPAQQINGISLRVMEGVRGAQFSLEPGTLQVCDKWQPLAMNHTAPTLTGVCHSAGPLSGDESPRCESSRRSPRTHLCSQVLRMRPMPPAASVRQPLNSRRAGPCFVM